MKDIKYMNEDIGWTLSCVSFCGFADTKRAETWLGKEAAPAVEAMNP